MSTLLQDVKYALRGLIKRPAFTIVAVLSLALGVGANTAIFTVINAVFLHPLAIDEPQRVVESFTRDTQTVQAAGLALTPTSLQNYVDYRDRNAAFSGLAAYFQNGFQWTRNGETTGVPGMLTTANYFDVLGVKPALGRFFSPDEDLDHAVPVAVISHSVWLTQFGGERTVLGQSMTLDNLSFSIIGVAADGFKGTQSLAGPDCIWIPLGMRDQILTGQLKSLMTNRRFRWINIIGRLKPAVSLAQADASMKTIAASLAQEFPDANRGRTIDLALVSDAALGINNRQQFVSVGTVMMTVVGLVLLIACANLANLLLAQAAKRQREMSVRAALGASRGRLIRQLLVESSVLAIAGGLAGLAIAYWGRNALWAFRPPFLGDATIDLSFDTRVLLFTGGIAVLTGVLFGLMPALRLSRTRLNETLKIGGRSGSLGAATQRVRSGLVAAEIALATVALIGSGLFVRSMQAAETMDVGFDAAHLAFIRLAPGAQHYDQARGLQFYDEAIAKATQMPGVAGAAVASLVPLAGGNGVALTVFAEGRAQDPTAHGSLIPFNDITPGYFAAIRQTFKAGRDFSEFDRAESTPVAIINDTAAKVLWPGEDALHKRFTIVQQSIPYEVVGIVATRPSARSARPRRPWSTGRFVRIIPRPVRSSCGRRRIPPRNCRRCAIKCRRSTRTCRCAPSAPCRSKLIRACGRPAWARCCSASSAASPSCWR